MEHEVEEFKQHVAPEVFLSSVLTVGLLVASFYDFLPWTIADSQGRKRVLFSHRCVLTLQLAFIDLLPVLACIFAVFNRRRQTYAIDPTDPRGKPMVEQLKGILENTLEQFVVKITLSFILCVVLRSNELILLPTFTFLFVVGRGTFALGYPTHRSFGMTMNFVSVVLISLLIAYRLLFYGVLFQYIYWK